MIDGNLYVNRFIRIEDVRSKWNLFTHCFSPAWGAMETMATFLGRKSWKANAKQNFSLFNFFFFLCGGGGGGGGTSKSKTRYEGGIKFQFVRYLINLYTTVRYTVVCIFRVTRIMKRKNAF